MSNHETHPSSVALLRRVDEMTRKFVLPRISVENSFVSFVYFVVSIRA
jgi:hypothetical protein